MKLELKHITDHIANNGDVILSDKGIFNMDSEHGTPFEATKPMKIINLIVGERIEIEIYSEEHNWGVGFIELDEILLLKRPLSDLKEDDKNNEILQDIYSESWMALGFQISITPTEVIIYSNEDDSSIVIYIEKPQLNKVWVNNVLLQHHFDTNNLIGKKLAIDSNSLK